MPESNNDVAIMSDRFKELEEARSLCRSLYGGTKSMIAASTKYLIKYPAETDANYKVRLDANILTNFLKQAVKKASGKLFGKPIIYKDDVPEEIVDLCKNIDRQDRSLDAFMMDICDMAFRDGISYIFVDMPTANDVVTRADEKEKNIRPYFVGIDSKNMLEIVAEMINGIETLTRVRFMERVQIPNGNWSYTAIDQVRVLKRIINEDSNVVIAFELYRQDEKGIWNLFESGLTTFDEIAIIPIYANRVGYMEGEPVFQETAELNLEHWRSKADQLNSLSFGRFAMLAGSGIPTESNVEIGPNKLLLATDPNAKFYYVESNGVGLEQGWKHLEKIEKSVETASAQLRVENQGRVTATAAAIESDETNAGLKAVARGMEEGVNKALDFVAKLIEVEKGGSIEINSNFGTRKGTEVGLQEIGKMATARIISPESTIRNLIWRGELPNDFDIEKNKDELKSTGGIPPTAEDIKKAQDKKMAKTGNA